MSRREAVGRAAGLRAGLGGPQPRGVGPALKRVKAAKRPADRPYSAPHYWAAFALIGDPD